MAELAALIAVRVLPEVLLPEQLQRYSLTPQLLDHHRKPLGQSLIARVRPRRAIALQHGQQLAVGQLLRLLPGQLAAVEPLQVLRHCAARDLQRSSNRSLTELGGHPVADHLFDLLHANPPACHAAPSDQEFGGSVAEDRTSPRPRISLQVAFFRPTGGFLFSDSWLS
jgi:hypothetical protein